jgi:hypothetical protein
MVMPDQILCAEPVQDEEIVMLRALMGNMSPTTRTFICTMA